VLKFVVTVAQSEQRDQDFCVICCVLCVRVCVCLCVIASDSEKLAATLN